MRWGFLLLGISVGVHAANFDEVEIAGACKEQNTQVIQNGEQLAVLFDDFGAQMPAGENGDGLDIEKICNFRVRISFPKDKYLASLRQVFSGGVIKSKGSRGALNLVYGIDKKNGNHTPLVWKVGQEITPESPDSIFTQSVVDDLPQPNGCSGKVKYGLRVAFRAARKSLKEMFIGGLDTYDAELVQRLDLIPTWKLCAKGGRK